ncbi:MAG: hypothetical protein M3O35_01610 [Acidobacteriota bacterium]|nr:hypothetical protein [Acidobacteriota bacterium]
MTRRAFLAVLYTLPFWGRERLISLAGIRFRTVSQGRSSRRYIHLHGNENTAREVLLDFVGWHKGQAFVVESDTRYVPILGGRLDPNRMFSRAGAEKNLKTLNPDWPPDTLQHALDALDRDRKAFLKRVLPPAGGLLIAMHNNGPGYSVNDETAISDRVALNDSDHPHDFCLATDASDFEVMAKSPFNVVLQATPGGEDDGSLSREAARRGKRYVNIEAALGNKDKQAEMLDWLARKLPEKRR